MTCRSRAKSRLVPSAAGGTTQRAVCRTYPVAKSRKSKNRRITLLGRALALEARETDATSVVRGRARDAETYSQDPAPTWFTRGNRLASHEKDKAGAAYPEH